MIRIPGSCTARPDRHGESASDSPRPRPATRIVALSNNAPDDETNDSRTGSRTRLGTRLLFTYGVPICAVDLDLQASQESRVRHALPCVTRRDRRQRGEVPRLGNVCIPAVRGVVLPQIARHVAVAVRAPSVAITPAPTVVIHRDGVIGRSVPDRPSPVLDARPLTVSWALELIACGLCCAVVGNG